MQRIWFGVWTLLIGSGPALAVDSKQVTEAKDHPEAVLIRSVNQASGSTSVCSGALITPRVVLTAGHGVYQWDRFEVTAPYVAGGPKRSTSTTKHIYPGYDPRKDYPERDLALLILDTPLAQPQELPTLPFGKLVPIETELLVVGRVKRGQVSRDKLFKGSVTRIAFPGNINIYGGFPKTVQKGDSGGPVFIKGREREIVAVISRYTGWSRRYVERDGYAPLTNKHRAWIEKHLPSD